MTLKDDDTFGRRLKRYTKVSLSAGKIAAQLAGDRYLGTSADPSKRAKQFMESLGDLKGPVMKIAQLLATIPDFLPDEYVTELLQLQANAPAMGWLFVKRRMRTELGLEWESKFKSFEKPAAAAASLGQVHRATSLEGKSLACKLQYPDMSSAVEADLKQFKIVLALYEQTNKAVLTKGVFQEIAERLREELDYELEAKHIALYTKILQPKPQVHLPIVHPELSTKRL
ncbi:MAG: AarF/ABC1/UbiB kinase family protein, partial [Alphaproteobacteria bacterium]|nr:AarF/ABC1/UbiB kinase family protein [Alphaproteobacteria bacterium]